MKYTITFNKGEKVDRYKLADKMMEVLYSEYDEDGKVYKDFIVLIEVVEEL